MTALELKVGASTDDARGSSGSMVLDGTIMQISASTNLGLVRFLDVTIPQGSTIQSAYFQGYFNNADYDTVACTCAAIDEDNVATFETTTITPTWTTATTAVNITDVTGGTINAFYTIADIASAVEEVVNRVGWASGNALGVGLYSRTSGDMRIRTYDNNAATGAKLLINYTAPATGAKKLVNSRTRLSGKVGGLLT